jgi:hypothetical protein
MNVMAEVCLSVKNVRQKSGKIYKTTNAMRLPTGLMKDNAAESHRAIVRRYSSNQAASI